MCTQEKQNILSTPLYLNNPLDFLKPASQMRQTVLYKIKKSRAGATFDFETINAMN